MSIYDSRLWIESLDEMIAALPELEGLKEKSVMLTGCTGLIGSAVVDILIRWNETHENKIRILAAARNDERIKERFFPYDKKDWFMFVPYDASSVKNRFPKHCDYIIHGAGNASANQIVREPVETMISNFIGMKYLLDYAKRVGAKRALFISTSEVYGRNQNDGPKKTDDYGWIDILNPRSSYSIGKCATETLCASYYDEYGVDSVIVRPGHIYGPTAQKTDYRVSSAWAYNAARGEDIIMKSDGSQIRSYCYCLDCASAILKALLKGTCIQAYNISNPDSIISIREMAQMLSELAGVGLRVELPTENEKKGFNPMKDSSLDSTGLLKLGWNALFDAKRGFSHTIKIIKDRMNQSRIEG